MSFAMNRSARQSVRLTHRNADRDRRGKRDELDGPPLACANDELRAIKDCGDETSPRRREGEVGEDGEDDAGKPATENAVPLAKDKRAERNSEMK